MPLAHNSLSHGIIPFGFFNIETDILLLDRLFFFAPEFCRLIEDIAALPPEQTYAGELPGYSIEDPMKIGDLHGAIAGLVLQGFIGALYRLWPFPQDRSAFHQQPEGAANRKQVETEIGRFGRELSIPVSADPDAGILALGPYQFSPLQFKALVDYVWRGGMPGWRQGIRPDYLEEMAAKVSVNGSPWLKGLVLAPENVGVRY
ncbi:MAG: hypothetical protein PVG03_09525 [Desulfarculaceae bacterium]|jgi:hypothetical protein